TAGLELVNTGQMSGQGKVAAPLIRNTGTLDVTSPTIVSGNVINSGLIAGAGDTRFAGTYSGDGTYRSGPGQSRFDRATVGPLGFWVGGDRTVFLIDNALDVGSTKTAEWDTARAR